MLNKNKNLVLSWNTDEEILRSLKILFIFRQLFEMYGPDTVLQWLHGRNGFVGDQQPIELIRQGKLDEVLGAIQQERAGSYM